MDSVTVILIVLLGALAGGGVYLLVDSLSLRERPLKETTSLLDDIKGLGARVPLAVGAALLTLLFTRGWLVAALVVGGLVLSWNQIFGGNKEERLGIARIEALAAWTESLRDTVAGAVGLEQAIPATAYAAAPVIQGDLTTLADRLRVRVPLPVGLQRFAEDLDDPSADLIIAALILNSRLRGPGLRDVLGSLSESARAELDMRQRVNAGRAAIRRSVQIVVGFTIFVVAGLALFNPEYVAPYGTPVGQIVLLLVFAVFAAGIIWMRQLSKFETPARFLHFRGVGS